MLFAFFKRLFQKPNFSPEAISSLFDIAPFLTPWYFSETKPALLKKGRLLKWEFIENIRGKYVSLIALKDYSNNLLGLIKSFNYVHAKYNNSKFMIWSRDNSELFISIKLYEAEMFSPLELNKREMLEFDESENSHLFSCSSCCSFKYVIDTSLKEDIFLFPEEFKIFDPFLVVCSAKGLYEDSEGYSNCLILEFNPQSDSVKYFPQDWFNKSNADFGYEWITRAVKDKNGVIHGTGIRISDFTLDETGTQLQK
jgi:hypothetical protein